MEELSISWECLIHPDMEAIRRRDEFLNSNLCENIEFIGGEIHADITCWCGPTDTTRDF